MCLRKNGSGVLIAFILIMMMSVPRLHAQDDKPKPRWSLFGSYELGYSQYLGDAWKSSYEQQGELPYLERDGKAIHGYGMGAQIQFSKVFFRISIGGIHFTDKTVLAELLGQLPNPDSVVTSEKVNSFGLSNDLALLKPLLIRTKSNLYAGVFYRSILPIVSRVETTTERYEGRQLASTERSSSKRTQGPYTPSFGSLIGYTLFFDRMGLNFEAGSGLMFRDAATLYPFLRFNLLIKI